MVAFTVAGRRAINRAMLHINDLTYRIAGRMIFQSATLTVPTGHRVGLVGRNGSGKTTLFRLITHELAPDGGTISVQSRAKVGHVSQEAPGGDTSLIDTVLAVDTELAALTTESETATDPGRIAEIHTRLSDIEAHTAPARASAILAGLGFDEAAQGRPCGSFSGGWRMRVALAGALFARPDLLLLDEPTNHLDLEATLWLESHLASWRGTLIVISHDRRLLNKVIDEIAHLENGKLTRYTGGYDRFENARREQQAQQGRLYAKQQLERRRIQAFVDRFRAQATKARQAQSRLKMLARMEPIASVVEGRTVEFTFPDPAQLSPPVIALDDVSVGYGDAPPILQGLDLRIDMEDRIALLGANGNGKSTFMRLLARRLEATSGRVTRSKKLRVGYFAQHQVEELNLQTTAYDHVLHLIPKERESKIRGYLGKFGFDKDRADTMVDNLSGGEKARLLFALMAIDAPHVILLDEPTNHLDVDSREALVEALNEYKGAVVVVSHDPHLIEMTCDRLWLVTDGTCAPFDGDMEDYTKLLLEQRRGSRRADKIKPGGNKKQARRERAAARAETAGLRKAARDAEKKMGKISTMIEKMETELAGPGLYDASTEQLQQHMVRHGKLRSDLAAAEVVWLKAEEAIEKAG